MQLTYPVLVILAVIATVLVGPVWSFLRSIAHSQEAMAEIARQERIENQQVRVEQALAAQRHRNAEAETLATLRKQGKSWTEQYGKPAPTGPSYADVVARIREDLAPITPSPDNRGRAPAAVRWAEGEEERHFQAAAGEAMASAPDLPPLAQPLSELPPEAFEDRAGNRAAEYPDPWFPAFQDPGGTGPARTDDKDGGR